MPSATITASERAWKIEEFLRQRAAELAATFLAGNISDCVAGITGQQASMRPALTVMVADMLNPMERARLIRILLARL